jgi:hexosaminidase
MKITTSSFRIFIYLLLVCILLPQPMFAQYNITPHPQQLIPLQGKFILNNNTVILCDMKHPEIKRLAQQFSDQLEIVSGLKLNVIDIENADTINALIFKHEKPTLNNPESYDLEISPTTIQITAIAPIGFFYGLQTLYQLLPVEIYGKKLANTNEWSAPSVQIIDAPRFAYRGMHLDVGRHYFSLEFIKKFIDAMAIHKFNKFHWHLTEDQGWRIEIKKYPKLTEIGSKREETLTGHFFERLPQQYDNKPYGGFYTQDEAREIVAYAADRFIEVIPEIEMPGHAQAALASYPHLSCTKDSTIKVATRWGIFKDVFCPRETTFHFLVDVLTEIMDIFPSKYIHIGGDECPKDRWKSCPDCQALIKSKNLKNEHELQSYFIGRIEDFLNSKDRQIIGWDEILDGGLAPNATVMSWRGTKGGVSAAKAGHKVIMTPSTHCYFDHYQSNPETEPLAFGGYTPLSKVYHYEPVPQALTSTEAKHILGAQANVWTEYLPTSEHVEYMVFPRISAMAEVLWSQKDNRNWDSFRKRLITNFQRYEQQGIKPSDAFFDVHFTTAITSDKKLRITLSCDHPETQIRYSMNGNIQNYTSPILLNESSSITATAFLNEKIAGKSISKSFIVSKLTGLSYSKNATSSWYDGGNANPLTDGITGNTRVYTQWLGFSKKRDAQIIVDLKTVQKVERFSVGLLNAPALCVLASPQLKLYGSANGKEYQLLAEKEIPTATAPTWEILRPELTFPLVKVRYLKLELKNAGACPADRTEKLDGSMIFVDEIGAW